MMKRFVFALLIIFQSVLVCTAQQKSLNEFIEIGLQNSPLLKDYQNQVLMNRIDSMRLHASLLPQVNAFSNNLYAPVIKGWGYDDAITNGANITAALSVSKEITGSKNRANQYKSIGLESQSLRITGKISETDLKKNITESYILAYGLWQQYSQNLELIALLKQEEEIVKKLAEQGVYKQTDYLSFRVNLNQQQLAAEQLNISYRNNLAGLNELCGIKDTSFAVPEDPDISLNPVPGTPNTLVYRQFVIDSLKLSTQDKQIDFMYKPKVSLYADAGYYSSLILTPWKNFGTSIGININVPIYDGNQRKMQHDKVSLSAQTLQSYRDFYSNQYEQRVNSILQQLQASEQLSTKINDQIEYTKTLVEASRKLLETGDIQITDYLIAVANYMTARNAVVENKVARYILINELNNLNVK